MFKVECADGWGHCFARLDNSIKRQIARKIDKLAFPINARHLLHGLPYFVVQVGQYRIVFEEIGATRILLFVGDHKQYEMWLAEQRI